MARRAIPAAPSCLSLAMKCLQALNGPRNIAPSVCSRRMLRDAWIGRSNR